MLNVLYICLAFSFCILQVKSQSSDYTWEDYDGTIPEKAFLASDDPNNPVYVGMAKVGRDNCTGSLLPGANEMAVECNGRMNKVKEGLKILTVTDPKRFKWFPAPRKDRFWADIGSVGKAVTCGTSVYRQTGTLVGRTITDDDGTLEVGHINNPVFYLVHKDTKRQKTSGYEILINVNKPVPAPPQSEEYTWEDYDGTIPEKAFSSSDDPNNPVYVGLALVYADYCPGTLLPGATQITVECYGVYTVKEGLKILTVNDPKTFKWFLAPRKGRFWKDIESVGKAVTSGTSVTRKTTTLVGRTIAGNNGIPTVGHINGVAFHSVQNNSQSQISSGYEILIIVKKAVPPPPEHKEYAWVDYDGTIPQKAFSSSDDPNNPVYVGLGLIYADYCPGTLLPGATEITVECYGVYTLNESLKILTINDTKKFRWISAPSSKGTFWDEVGSVGQGVTSGKNLARQGSSTLVGRTIIGDNLIVGHINNAAFYFIHNNTDKEKSSDYEILVIVKEPAPALPQNEEPSASEAASNPNQPTADAPSASEEPAALNSTEPTVDTNVDLKTESDPQAAPKEPSTPKAQSDPPDLIPCEPTVDPNLDLKVEADASAAPKEPSASKEPSVLNPSEPTIDTNVDLKVEANAPVAPKKLSASKEPAALNPSEPTVDPKLDLKVEAPTAPKKPSTSKEPAVLNPSEPTVDPKLHLKVEPPKEPAALNPSESTVDPKLDLKVEAGASAAPKEPSASKEPSVLNPSEPTVDTNVDLKVEANAPVAPKKLSASKEPPALNPSEPTVDPKLDLKVEADAPTAPKKPSASKEPSALNPSEPTVDPKLDLKVEATTAPKKPSAFKEPAVLNPSEPTVDPKLHLKVEADTPAAPKEPAALNPSESTVDPKVDLKVEADAPAAPKEPSASKGPAAFNLGQPTVGTNVDLNVEPGTQAAPEATFASKAPSYSNSWSSNYWREYGSKAATDPQFSPKAPATPNQPAGAYFNSYQFGR